MTLTDTMNPGLSPASSGALKDFLFQLADDEFICGHRNSEWLGLAPDIEEDVAFASIAQDEIGHATYYYGLLETLGEGDADSLAFSRPAEARRNTTLLEFENGDWALTIVRQYLYHVFDNIRLQALVNSSYSPLAEAAIKIIREEYFHSLHLETLFKRLICGTSESRTRMKRALQVVWSELPDMFSLGAYAPVLLETGIVSKSELDIRVDWAKVVRTVFAQTAVVWPGDVTQPGANGRLGAHTSSLDKALLELSEVYRLDPVARW